MTVPIGQDAEWRHSQIDALDEDALRSIAAGILMRSDVACEDFIDYLMDFSALTEADQFVRWLLRAHATDEELRP